MHTAEWSWVDTGGHLTSGDDTDLVRAYRLGQLTAQSPVTRSGWLDWLSLSEVLEDLAPDTEPVIALARRLDDEEAIATLKRPAVAPLPSTSEELTKPMQPAVQPYPLPPMIVGPRSLPPVSHDVGVATGSTRASSALPVVLGLGLAAAGATLAAAIVIGAASQRVSEPMAAGLTPPSRASDAPAAALPVAPEATTPSRCTARGAFTRVAARVPRGSAVAVAPRAPGVAAVGVNATQRTGVGLTLDVERGAVQERLPVADAQHLGGVTPLADGFAADRYFVTVDTTPRFGVGMTPGGFARIAPDGSSNVLWPGEAAAIITRPVVTRAGDGFLVAFRRGDGAGSVRAGFITAQGEARGALTPFASDALTASAPAIAADGERAVLVWTESDARGRRRVVGATGTAAAGFGPARPLDIGSGDARSAAVARLSPGRFLVTWVASEQDGRYGIRARVFDATLSAVGAPTHWLQGEDRPESVALWADGSRALALVLRRKSSSTSELWALPAACE